MRAFLYAHGATAFATGIHLVLLAWLGVSELALSPHELGLLQAAGLLPNIVFMLIAGVFADRYRATRLYACALLFQAAGYVFLAFLIYTHSLSFMTLVVYAAQMGIANAFATPAREKLLTDFASTGVQNKISSASIVQFSLQSVGILAASFSSHLGVLQIVLCQVVALVIAVCSVFAIAVPIFSPAVRTISSVTSGLIHGVKAVVKNETLLQLNGLIAFNGFMHIGVFIVAIPVIARDVYHLNALQYGLVQLTFALGMILAHSMLRYKKARVQYPGHVALFSLLYTAVIGFAFSMGPTLSGLYMLVGFWGWVAGNSAAHCRMVLQVAVWPEIKGRAVSIYQAVLFGMAPVGALTMGYWLHVTSVETVFRIMSGCSVALFVFFLIKKPLWQVKISE